MPSFKYFISESAWSIREFLRTTRQIHAVFPALTIYAFWRIIFEYRKFLDYSQGPNTIPLGLFSLFTIAFAFVVCFFGSAIIGKSQPRFWPAKYLIVVGLSVSPMELFFLLELDRSGAESVISFLRLLLLVVVAESIAGFLISQVQKRTRELESHQKSLLLAEEKFRGLVSNHLHDNLQTRLVAIGIQLNQIRGTVDAVDSAKILAVIDDIENIRSQEVRDFGKGIQPNFQVDGLEESLQRLFTRYKGVISCQVHSNNSVDINDQNIKPYALGIYRIVEQALSNGLTHGRATEFNVYVSRSSESIDLKIFNNGISFEYHKAVQGHGFAVIDAWVSEFEGSWALSNFEANVLLEVKFKI